jgi:hypothetical protein
MVRFCASMLGPAGAGVVSAFAAAPFIRNTARTLPTRSVTAITAGRLRACASAAACAITDWTSAILSASAAGTG